jgi:protein-tyrosine-phosphatase
MMRIDQDWELDDPVGQSLAVFEATAQEIERRMALL